MFSSTGLSPSTAGHPRPLRLTRTFLTVAQLGRTGKNDPTTPHRQRLPAITSTRFSLIRFRSPLLTESLLFSLPAGTEMFHFPAFPPHTLYIQMRVTRHHSCRVSPFGHPRITARLTAPRGLSQPPTSFIGSWCQGIHRTLLNTYKQRCSRPLYSSQTTHPARTEPETNTLEEGRYQRNPNQIVFFFLKRNTRVFFQDPTVCRLHPAEAGTYQRSTHEQHRATLGPEMLCAP